MTQSEPVDKGGCAVFNAVASSVQRAQQVRNALDPSKFVHAAARTGGFAARSVGMILRPSEKYPEIPVAAPTLTMLTSVFAEELMLLSTGGLKQMLSDTDELQRISHDVDRALKLMETNGWLDDPASYHRAPPAPEAFDLQTASLANLRYRRLSFDSGYEPVAGLPGGDRWMAMAANRTTYAHVLEHQNGERPWLVFVHGFGMGGPFDLVFQRALRFHRELGFNVLTPVLPLHGARRTGGRSGSGFVSLDWLANVHGLTQAVWDVRRCIAWIRGRGAPSVAVHGMSLGGYTTALIAGLDTTLDCVIAGVPSANIHGSLISAVAANPLFRRTVDNHELLGERTEAVHKVVTPTALPCRVPFERRFIYAGVADRLVKPAQPYALWEHWERPAICWSLRSHIFTTRSAKVSRFVEAAVTGSAAPMVERSPDTAHRR